MEETIDRTELLLRLERAYNRFRDAIAPLTETELQTAGAAGKWSIQDLVAHFIVHEQAALCELKHARRGERYQPAEQDTDRTNDLAVEEWAGYSSGYVLQAWEKSFRQVVAAVQGLHETDFDPAGALVQALGDTIDGAFGNNTYGHYAEHFPSVEAWIHQQKASR